VVGRLLAEDASLVREEARLRDDVGDHTWTHSDLALLPLSAARREIARTVVALGEVLGRRIVFFRPPYGASTPRLDLLSKRLDLLQILWSVDTRDSEGADAAQIALAIIAGARPGAIILLHENRGQTVKALLWMHALAALRARRLHPVTLTQLLTSDPPSRAQVAAGPRDCGEHHRSSHRG
jgi:peptidoglycan/xylan/chitin deacetylase (PgdA/CDA1 family)